MKKNEEKKIAAKIRECLPWTAHRKIEIPGCADLADGLAYILAEKIQEGIDCGRGRHAIEFSQGGRFFVLNPRPTKWEIISLRTENLAGSISLPPGIEIDATNCCTCRMEEASSAADTRERDQHGN